MTNRVEISKRLIFINSLAGIALDVANLGVLVWLFRYLDMDKAMEHVREMLPLIRRYGDLTPRERVRQIERLLEGY
jgi:hypothetical protein